MDIRVLIPELFEKVGLIVTAGLLGVLVPPLRNRLLGLGRPRDSWVAMGFGLGLSLWGATMGFSWLGHTLNLRAVGVMIAAILGGPRAGVTVGLLAGGFYVWRVVPESFPWSVLASVVDGLLAGWLVERQERYFVGWRAVGTAAAIQVLSLSIVALGMLSKLGAQAMLDALPSLGAQLVGVSIGVALFVSTARVVLAREANAVALVEARAATDALSLQALRSRLEPHFLFNALNTLRASIRTNPNRARALVSDLADLYRYLLQNPEDASIADEVDHACAYLEIERARLGDSRLVVQTTVDDSISDTRVPALLLQPIVENAVKHGIAPRSGRGLISIRGRDLGERLLLEVEDHSEGPLRYAPTTGSGMALETLRKRLQKHYDGRAELRLSSSAQGTLVTLDLPKQTKTHGGQVKP